MRFPQPSVTGTPGPRGIIRRQEKFLKKDGNRTVLPRPHDAALKEVLKGCFDCPGAEAVVRKPTTNVGGQVVGERVYVECNALSTHSRKGTPKVVLVRPSTCPDHEACSRRDHVMTKTLSNPANDPKVGKQLSERRKKKASAD